MALFITFTRYITVNKDISNLAIYRYTLNISKISIRLFRLTVLLKALNTIYRAASLLIPSSLITIIQ